MSDMVRRSYPLVGGGPTEAWFTIQSDGTLHIEFLMMLCKLWGPCKALGFSPRNISGHEVVDVSYVDEHSKTCWTVTLYKSNAEELQRLLPPKT